MKLKRVTVVAGPTQVAYEMNDGKITIWLGEYADQAPRTAFRTQIAAGATKFIVIDKDEMTEDERAQAQRPTPAMEDVSA